MLFVNERNELAKSGLRKEKKDYNTCNVMSISLLTWLSNVTNIFTLSFIVLRWMLAKDLKIIQIKFITKTSRTFAKLNSCSLI
jgi:hypothetical protein